MYTILMRYTGYQRYVYILVLVKWTISISTLWIIESFNCHKRLHYLLTKSTRSNVTLYTYTITNPEDNNGMDSREHGTLLSSKGGEKK